MDQLTSILQLSSCWLICYFYSDAFLQNFHHLDFSAVYRCSTLQEDSSCICVVIICPKNYPKPSLQFLIFSPPCDALPFLVRCVSPFPTLMVCDRSPGALPCFQTNVCRVTSHFSQPLLVFSSFREELL